MDALNDRPLGDRDAIAETIWRAEYLRATGKERLVSWTDGVSTEDKEKYRFIADALLAARYLRQPVSREALIEAEARRRCIEAEYSLDRLACQDRRFRHDDRRLWWQAEYVPAIRREIERLEKAGFTVTVPELTATCTKLLPGGKLDDSTYSEIEDALDRIEAPMTDGGRWLTLAERIAAIRLNDPAKVEGATG